MYGYPEPRTQDENATAVKADPRREVIENVILKNGCASTVVFESIQVCES